MSGRRPGAGPHPPADRRGRWLVLTAFALLVACTQLLWLTFAPITAQAHDSLGVSEGAIGDLAVLNPVLYVLLALPTGRWMDRRFATTLTLGAACTAGGAALRLVDPSSYGWIFAGQLVLSVGQPLVLNASTKIAARYVPPRERTAAISVATAAQFVGILAAALGTGPLFDAGGLPRLLLVHAVVALTAATALVVALRVVPAAYPVEPDAAPSLAWLRRDRLLWQLGALLFIGVGLFNAVATWLDTILSDLGNPGTGGTLIAVMTVAGIAGAALLPGAAARHDRRRELLMVTTATTVVAFLTVAVVDNVVLAGAVLAVEGFVLLAAFPVALDWSELESGPARAATATGFLLLAGNLGGAVLVLGVQALIGDPYLALVGIAALGVPGVLIASRLPRHVRAHGERQPEPEPDGAAA